MRWGARQAAVLAAGRGVASSGSIGCSSSRDVERAASVMKRQQPLQQPWQQQQQQQRSLHGHTRDPVRCPGMASVRGLEMISGGFGLNGSNGTGQVLARGAGAPAALASAPTSLVRCCRRQLTVSAAAVAAAGARPRRPFSTLPSHDGAGGGFATERDYHAAADAALDEVQLLLEGLEDTVEDFEANLAQGVLNIMMGEHGTWVLNKQTPNRQVWWSSPISGPLRFEYDAAEGKWRTTRGRRELFSLLGEEVHKVSGVDILQGH